MRSIQRCPTAGFTLIEFLVSLVIIGLLGMVAVPAYFSAHDRAAEALLVEDLRLTQFAIEGFAADFNGALPQGVDNPLPGSGFAYYFPGGDEDVQTRVGTYPKNPYSGQHMIAASFLLRAYRQSGDNRDESIGGPNDLTFGGLINYGVCPPWTGGQPIREYGLVACGRRGSVRIGDRIVVLHN